MAFLKEFKEFALKGNVMDMAVGVIIGGAFGKIVSSLVNDILMPPIGALIGNTDFSQLRLDISKFRDMTSSAVHAVGDVVTGGGEAAAKAAAEPVYWNYGAFIQQCIDFTILALCVFLMVKLMNRLMKKKDNLKTVCYLLMSWVVIIAFKPLIDVFQRTDSMYVLYWLIGGGLFYSLGTIFFFLDKYKYMHSAWHLFVLGGTVCHFIAIYNLV